jgi:TatD DNase family protein
MLIDTHCHYNLDPLYSGKPDHFHLKHHSPLLKMNWHDHWQKAQQYGVRASIVVGTTYETTQRALDIAQAEPALWAAPGIHPNECLNLDKLQEQLATGEDHDESWQKQTDFLQKEFGQLITTHPQKIIAVGETGLDFFYLPENPVLAEAVKQGQNQFFLAHLAVAAHHQLTPIIHVRDKELSQDPTSRSAYWRIIEALKSNWSANRPFILHCISGPLDYVKQAIELGGYIGVAANITYKNADQLRELVRVVPKSRLLLETDAPYLPPIEHRGKICEPWMVSQTAKFLQVEMGISQEQLLENTNRIFPQLSPAT